MTIDRRTLMLAGAAAGATALLPGCAAPAAPASAGKIAATRFVSRQGRQLMRDGRPYRYVGANIWYAAWLGADAPYGDRARLGRELDRLKALGVGNVRILASAEQGPLKNSVKPGFRTDGTTASFSATLLGGLDFTMAEIGRRGMTAVLYLTNFWEWSGGMGTYLHYATGRHMDMNDPAHPWPAFADHNAAFYTNAQALGMFADWVRALVGRTNGVTGVAYAADPAIMAWQLCNEPRPGGSAAVIEATRAAYNAWIADTAALIRSIDVMHLVSLGQEGTIASQGREDVYVEAHQHIDYLTAHVWPLNWGWVDGKNLGGTWDAGRAKVEAYVDSHVAIADRLGKPLVIEEFGFPRDGERYDPKAGTTFRERYYKLIYDRVEASVAAGGALVASNFWAWNGEARTANADWRFRDGDRAYMGDPPHEPQGWYGNFDSDTAMLALIQDHAARLQEMA